MSLAENIQIGLFTKTGIEVGDPYSLNYLNRIRNHGDFKAIGNQETIEAQGKHQAIAFMTQFTRWLKTAETRTKLPYTSEAERQTLVRLADMVDTHDNTWTITHKGAHPIGPPTFSVQYGSPQRYARIHWDLEDNHPYNIILEDTVAREPVYGEYIFLPTHPPTPEAYKEHLHRRPRGKILHTYQYKADKERLELIAYPDTVNNPKPTYDREIYKYVAPFLSQSEKMYHVWAQISATRRSTTDWGNDPPTFSGPSPRKPVWEGMNV